eukprot:1327552-Amorphochlora_amoeboformis.AAC.1
MVDTSASTSGDSSLLSSAEFFSNNLEVLGFGNSSDAVFQTVRELTENSVDAIAHKQGYAKRMEFVNVSIIQESPDLLNVKVQDTGIGIVRDNIIRLMGCVFGTSKSDTKETGTFGLGVKGILLYAKKCGLDGVLTVIAFPIHQVCQVLQVRQVRAPFSHDFRVKAMKLVTPRLGFGVCRALNSDEATSNRRDALDMPVTTSTREDVVIHQSQLRLRHDSTPEILAMNEIEKKIKFSGTEVSINIQGQFDGNYILPP